MNDLDHMLNGKTSRQHHQEMIRQAQQAKLAREAKHIKPNRSAAFTLSAVLTALISLIVR
ncbi:MAG: hypothetical protein KF716_05045 [Anaerolineae bacterium]|nr:hypothetical protein [Anaerolineae bacterium]